MEKYTQLVFPKNTATHCQFENQPLNQQPFDHQPKTLQTDIAGAGAVASRWDLEDE